MMQERDFHQLNAITDLIVVITLVAHVLSRVLFILKSSRGSLISTLESEFVNRHFSYRKKHEKLPSRVYFLCM